MSAPQPPPTQRGIFSDFFFRILEWLDRPWKAFALVGIAIVIGLGYGGWMSRDTLVEAWKLTSGRPILKRSELATTLKNLQINTGADIVGYWSLNLSANSMIYEAALKRGEHWDFKPTRLPAIRDPVSQPNRLSQFLAGTIVCRNPQEDSSEDLVNRQMASEKIAIICLVPVPPAPNILVGILMLGWVVKPDSSTEEAALGLARETASTMVSRWE